MKCRRARLEGWFDMKVLVTGATGRVGSRFVPRLILNGEDVRVLVRDAERAEPLRAGGAEIQVGDVGSAADLARAVDGVDAVVNIAAAFRGVADEEAEAVNHLAAVELARTALAAGVTRYVFPSTNLVYGPGRGRPTREDDVLRPEGSYPVSKVAAEEALRRMHREDGLDLRIVRLAFVYGEDDPHLAESMMWARDWSAHQRFHMVHHADVGQALLLALRAAGVAGRAYNVADDAPVTAAELHILNGEPLAPEAADRPLPDPWGGIVDTTRIRAQLGFRPIYPSVYTARDAGAL
jgi:nucleoside-diphosphate-sugar epimerase